MTCTHAHEPYWFNVIIQHSALSLVAASAVFNSNSRIMVAALKFFLGQDQAADEDSDADDDDEDFKAVQPSKAEVYKANSKASHLQIACLLEAFSVSGLVP